MLKSDLPYFNDPEGSRLPDNCKTAIDAHVHVFPDNIFQSIWDWFDTHAWKIRYRMRTSECFQFLLDKGFEHVIALQYAHRPGIAEILNQYLAKEITSFQGRISGMATVFPGEPGAGQILKQAFSSGLCGVKLHAHVQCFDMNADYMDEIYQICSDERKPMIMHVGKEPKSPAYKCDTDAICDAGKLESVVKNFPQLNVCVPHLGFSEIDEYRMLIEKYDTVWTDTTMVLTDYFPVKSFKLSDYRSDRVMFGTDFPNIPYEWDREIKILADAGLDDETLERILYKNARIFFNL